ncbi:VOC family protein [Azorhizobium sp. AG788]|uniref:VOC family protein n=1 Tax=Azorhizobium sp. AG788 TaxID=2183897 RepID=UPI003139657E
MTAAAAIETHPALSAHLSLGPVSLRTRDPERLAHFYEQAVGLSRLGSTTEDITLGAGDAPLVILLRDPAAVPLARPAPGLFHLAVRVPDRKALAARIHALRALGVPFGASDHLVSEALYVDDPDGNGVEIYRDRAPAEWPRDSAGGIAMATLRLDVAAVAAEIPLPDTIHAAPAGTDMGHVHLKVSDLGDAHRFWHDTVGFDIMARYPGALFVAAGGYHHHLGLNVWQSAHAAPPPAASSGLAQFEIRLPPDEIPALAARVAAAGYPVEQRGSAIVLTDPSGNTAHVVAA